MTGRQSVELLDDFTLSSRASRCRGVPVRTRASRSDRAHSGILLGVAACHGLLGWLAVTSVAGTYVRDAAEPLISVFVRPRVIRVPEPERTSTLPTMLKLPADSLLSEIPIPELDRPTTLMAGVGTMAPRPEGELGDPSPFAQRAGLAEGEGATVVLRVEVYGSGDVGRIEVDVSGGSEPVNAAAISYVRSLPWSGGRVDGQPATMWIRWGVRLQA